MTNPNTPRKRRWVFGLVGLLGVVLVITVISVLSDNGPPPPPGSPPPQGQGPQTSASVPPPAKPAGCPDVQVIFVPGSYETNPGADPAVPVGLLTGVGQTLGQRFAGQPGRLSDYFVPYLAQFNNPTPYFVSEQDGVRAASAAMAATAQRCPAAQFGLVGFSQGADAAGDLAATIGGGKGPIAAAKLFGVALISDPKRDPATERLIGPPVDGAGILGQRSLAAVKDRVVTFCATGDVICATPPSAANLANLPATLALIDQSVKSGVHSSYRSYQVKPGQSATQWLAGWLGEMIEKAPRG